MVKEKRGHVIIRMRVNTTLVLRKLKIICVVQISHHFVTDLSIRLCVCACIHVCGQRHLTACYRLL